MKPLKLTPEQAQAAHEGRKTQHREITKFYKLDFDRVCEDDIYCITNNSGTHFAECYHSIGDKVFVQEPWQAWTEFNSIPVKEIPSTSRVNYLANGTVWDAKKRPASHMPQWASRTALEIIDIRVERLNEISEEDAKAEGTEPYRLPVHPEQENKRHILGFSALWNAIHGLEAWDANPYVFVYEFRRVEV